MNSPRPAVFFAREVLCTRSSPAGNKMAAVKLESMTTVKFKRELLKNNRFLEVLTTKFELSVQKSTGWCYFKVDPLGFQKT